MRRLLDEKMLREAALKGPDRPQAVAARRQPGFEVLLLGSALDQVILQTPEFQEDGKFSPERFDQVIRQLGYGRLQFRDMLTQEMLIGQLRAGLAGSGFVTDEK
jgi:peptidyl-prolyl cis-trans isomerase D